MRFFYLQGIPDKTWHIWPGRRGSSVEYFPYFEEHHFLIKDWFDYYSDTFYSNAFSAMDMVGQWLNLYHRTGLPEDTVSFQRVLSPLSQKSHGLYVELEGIRTDPSYMQAAEFRNGATHRVLPSTAGMAVTRTPTGWALGLREYITSDAFIENAGKVLALIEKTIEIMIKYSHTEEAQSEQ